MFIYNISIILKNNLTVDKKKLIVTLVLCQISLVIGVNFLTRFRISTENPRFAL